MAVSAEKRPMSSSPSLPPSPAPDATAIDTSLDPRDSLRLLARRRWRPLDLNYVALAALALFCLHLLPATALLKAAVTAVAVLLLLVPLTRHFFLPSLPIWLYLLFFCSSRFIPTASRPAISVRVLPALESVLCGVDFPTLLSLTTHPVLDLLAWFPYGIFHYVAPAVVSAVLFVSAAPGTAPMFARAFGWLGIIGVALQVLLPCTPPWYMRSHGLEPAQYGMPGDAAGLARIDALLGADLYSSNFAAAPVPFGAFPSLHAADAVLEALFVATCFPRLRIPATAYAAWVCWAAVYLGHHYAVDIVAGAALAFLVFAPVHRFWLPRPQPGKRNRWAYEYVEYGIPPLVDDERAAGHYWP